MRYTELDSIIRTTALKNLPTGGTGDTMLTDDISEEDDNIKSDSTMANGRMSKVKALLEVVQKQKQRRAADSSVYARLLRRASNSQKVSLLLNPEERSLLQLMGDDVEESPGGVFPSTPDLLTSLDLTLIETATTTSESDFQNNIPQQQKAMNQTKRKEENFTFEEAFGNCQDDNIITDTQPSLDEEISKITFNNDSNDQYSFGDHFSLFEDEKSNNDDLFPEQPFQSLEKILETNNDNDTNLLFPQQALPENLLLPSYQSENKKNKNKKPNEFDDTDDLFPSDQLFPAESFPEEFFPDETFPEDNWTGQQQKNDWTKEEEVPQVPPQAKITSSSKKDNKKQQVEEQRSISSSPTTNVREESSPFDPKQQQQQARLVSDLDWEGGKGQYTGVAIMKEDGVLVAHGRGKLVLANGDIYVGPFQFGCMHGSGATYRSVTGGEYFGSYNQNRKHGFGEAKSASGSRYVGQYRNDLPNGFGIQYGGEDDDAAVYCGDWKNGVPGGREKSKRSDSVVASDDFLDVCPSVNFVVAPPSQSGELPMFKTKLKKEIGKKISRTNNNSEQDTSIQSDETKIHVNTDSAPNRNVSPSSPSPSSSSSTTTITTSSSSLESSTLSDYEISRYNPVHEELMTMEETKRTESSPTSFRAMESLLS